MTDKEQYARQVVDRIFDLYERHGNSEYGEQVTMLMHMMQAAVIAEQTGFNDEMVIAAFLHDIGHFFEGEEQMDQYGTRAHDNLGSSYLLEVGFPERMAKLVGSHVAAKRYLTWFDSAYYETLSEASKQTLIYQGGPMTEEEALAFKSDPLFHQYIQLRIWDDMGKDANIPVNPSDVDRMKDRTFRYLLAHLQENSEVAE
ncbi:HDIG domain-containing protein [Chitinophaga terrae (ex Kim and Jung 2007)]|uniref:HDIG domain-containing protein n=1 Tax=Chitinophaga terrae (ex Kim and Jung 2007) TaxID=408074 RepID=A0A1H4CBA5_9BACT|nr:HDIG domain-containing metalloprotein [Chitinophaga terrae (ex Kim and Jung 2007)]GEP88852.1 phosphodiesterase [Chitinophaga terrae (ex Kim and Jung 2007)]SEA57362.1 HDIG domain-containing protein [Chitinophaga terrae (ex Kim and Jung 2007)]